MENIYSIIGFWGAHIEVSRNQGSLLKPRGSHLCEKRGLSIWPNYHNLR